MTDHVTEWLGAYLDKELNGPRLRLVEIHLAACAVCRSELESLRKLSALLQEPLPQGLASTDKFVANLTLILPRRPEEDFSRKVLQVGWWLVPVGVLSVWVCLQIAARLTFAVSAAEDAGLLGHIAAWLQPVSRQTEWFSTTMSLFGNQLSGNRLITLETLNQVDLFIQNTTLQLTWQIALGLIYWGWIFSGWVRFRKKTAAAHSPQLPRASSLS
jgi:hypothetical protein